MKPYTRQASVLWLGTRRHGKGAVNTPSAALKMALYAARGGLKRRGTNPPELIAAAHAGSFALSLANELGEAGFSPHQIDTTATVTMEHIAAAWTLTQIHLDVVAAVPRVAECDFVDAALRAKANCPVSRALNANISMRAHLTRRAAEQGRKPCQTSAVPAPGLGPKNRARPKGASNQGRFAREEGVSPK
jgi:osmotically inducible protein OsmC